EDDVVGRKRPELFARHVEGVPLEYLHVRPKGLGDLLQVNSEHSAPRSDLLAREQAPAPWRRSQVQDAHTCPQELGLGVDFLELEDTSGRIAAFSSFQRPRIRAYVGVLPGATPSTSITMLLLGNGPSLPGGQSSP